MVPMRSADLSSNSNSAAYQLEPVTELCGQVLLWEVTVCSSQEDCDGELHIKPQVQCPQVLAAVNRMPFQGEQRSRG